MPADCRHAGVDSETATGCDFSSNLTLQPEESEGLQSSRSRVRAEGPTRPNTSEHFIRTDLGEGSPSQRFPVINGQGVNRGHRRNALTCRCGPVAGQAYSGSINKDQKIPPSEVKAETPPAGQQITASLLPELCGIHQVPAPSCGFSA